VPQEKTKDKYLVEAAKQIAAVGVGEGVKNGKGVVVIGGGMCLLKASDKNTC
jgi:hypothetical protein